MEQNQMQQDLGGGAVFPMGGKNDAFAQYFTCLLYTSRCV